MTKDFDEKDDEEADPARLAIKRAEAARKLCEAIKEMSVADVEGPSIAAGWAILSKSAARALDFDARLTASDILSKAHEILTSTLRDTTEALVGTHLSEEEHNTVSAPGPLGGCSPASTLQHRSRRSFSELMDLHSKGRKSTLTRWEDRCCMNQTTKKRRQQEPTCGKQA